VAHTSLWIIFSAGLLVLLMADLIAFGGKPRDISMREAVAWSALWIGVSLAFCLWLWWHAGRVPAMEFLSGYLIEKSLSVDNLFIFVLIFQYFAVRPAYQHRVLVWGIFGALALRGALIAAGAAFINSFSWSFYILGAFLIFASMHILFRKKTPGGRSLETSRALRWLSKTLPVAKTNAGGTFFIRENARWVVTPLLLALITIEGADLLFALDSIPAVFGVTRDPFIVFSSNACAVLGLRALYFVLAGWITRLRHLATGVAIVLLFIGLKMVAAHWIEISSGMSLAVIAFFLAVAIGASFLDKRGGAENIMNFSSSPITDLIAQLESASDSLRDSAARELFRRGRDSAEAAIASWRTNPEIRNLISDEATVGIAVTPSRFAGIRAALNNPLLADVPPDQDAQEFEWALDNNVRLDILTTRTPEGQGAIAKFLAKFGEGIQQVEFITRDIDRATALLQSRLVVTAVYPASRVGADATRVNFFLANAPIGGKILIELVEPKK
jgi:TerC family integral membrane protein